MDHHGLRDPSQQPERRGRDEPRPVLLPPAGNRPSPMPTKWEFNLNWPKEFTAQVEGGKPIHAYIQLPGDPANTWRDWTPQSTGICWTYSSPADNVNPNNLPNCGGQYGKITVNNVPAGRRSGSPCTSTSRSRARRNRSPSRSRRPTVRSGPTSRSSTSRLGSSSERAPHRPACRPGKKVTVVYGTTVKASGNPVGGVWLKVQQEPGLPCTSRAM